MYLVNEKMVALLKGEQKRTDAMRTVINRYTEALSEENVQLFKGMTIIYVNVIPDFFVFFD